MKKFWLLSDINGNLVNYNSSDSFHGCGSKDRKTPDIWSLGLSVVKKLGLGNLTGFEIRENRQLGKAIKFNTLEDAETAAKLLNRRHMQDFYILECVAQAIIPTHIFKMED